MTCTKWQRERSPSERFEEIMEITCPSCGKSYNIPHESIGEQGRKVRCTSCDHRWLVMPESAEDDEARLLAEVLDQAAEEIDHFDDEDDPSADGDPENSDDLEAAFDEAISESGLEDDLDPFDKDEEDEPPELPTQAAPPVKKTVVRQSGGASSFMVIGGWLLLLVGVLTLGGLVIARDEVVDAYPSAQPIYQTLGLPITRRLGLEIRDVATETVEKGGARVLRVSGTVHNISTREREVPMIVVRLLDGENTEVNQQLVVVDPPLLPTESVARFVLDIEQPPETAERFSVSFDIGQ